MTVAIKVENLSKKYIISHEKKSASYEKFSESLIQTGRDIGNRIIHPFHRSESTPEKEEFWALKDINFEINQGDKVGIIGRNGAGKSTLLKVLSRITEPTSGKIHINGRIASLLEVGTGFHPELTGRENIFLNGAILGMSRKEIKQNFDEIVAFSEAENFLDTPVKRYSSGMYVRLAFSVAAHLESEILVVDEVLAVGDAEFQKKCLGKMNEVSKAGRTVLFVSHNVGMIRKLCTKGVYMEYGGCKFVGEIDKCIGIYQDEMVDVKRIGFEIWKEGGAILKDILVYSNPDSKAPLIVFNQGIIFEIEFELLRDSSSVSFHLGVDDQYGYRITTIDSGFNKFKVTSLKRGLYKLVVQMTDLQLMPGNYMISKFMIKDQVSEVGLFLGDILCFSISEVVETAPVKTGFLLASAGFSIRKS